MTQPVRADAGNAVDYTLSFGGEWGVNVCMPETCALATGEARTSSRVLAVVAYCGCLKQLICRQNKSLEGFISRHFQG